MTPEDLYKLGQSIGRFAARAVESDAAYAERMHICGRAAYKRGEPRPPFGSPLLSGWCAALLDDALGDDEGALGDDESLAA